MRSHLRFATVFPPATATIPPSHCPMTPNISSCSRRCLLERRRHRATAGHRRARPRARLFFRRLFRDAAPLILVLAGLQDPGNVGTLLRSAEAFAANGVLLLPGTASPWNPKALRASAGSAFRVPAFAANETEALALLATHHIPAIAAVARDGMAAVPCRGRAAGRSVRPAHRQRRRRLSEFPSCAAAHRITIPMPGNVESLNAAIAGSLLLYEASRQRAKSPQLQYPHEPLRRHA